MREWPVIGQVSSTTQTQTGSPRNVTIKENWEEEEEKLYIISVISDQTSDNIGEGRAGI